MPDNPEGTNIEGKSDNENPRSEAIPPPAPPDSPTPPNTQPVGGDDEHNQIQKLEDRIEAADRWMIWLTGAIAFFGLCSVVVSIFQWREINRGSADTSSLATAAKKQAQKMSNVSDAADKIRQAADSMVTQDQRIADNAEKSLKANGTQSRTALETTVQNSRLDERAWVVASGFKLSEEPSLNKPFTTTVSVSNTGKTPALEVVPESSLYLWSGEPPGDIPPNLSPVSKAIVAPGMGGLNFTTAEFTLTSQAQIDVYHGKTSNVYLKAIINYRDAFKGSHWTKVCAYHISGDPLESWKFCAHGNEMDEYR